MFFLYYNWCVVPVIGTLHVVSNSNMFVINNVVYMDQKLEV